VTQILSEAGVIAHPTLFRFYANHWGSAGKIKAGRYTLSRKMTPRQMIGELVKGAKEEEVEVTIPEGKNLVDVGQLLAQAGVCPAAEVLAAARDPHFATELGLPGPTLEGYLFPDTYKLRPGTQARKALAAMTRRFAQTYADLRRSHAQGLAALEKSYGFTDREVVILASIVEKETGAREERPHIASVFLNRLRLPTFRPKLLQTDPTILYGCTALETKSEACSKFTGRIRRIHLEDRQNPYNTYTHEGLPPGPIANPGRASLEAVMQPDDNNEDLYFVARNDGTHQFSRTRAEHQAAVNKYQRGGEN
jgi:UPF0755 protein